MRREPGKLIRMMNGICIYMRIQLQQHAIQLQDSKANPRSQDCHLHDYRIQVSKEHGSNAASIVKWTDEIGFLNATNSLPFVAAKWQM